MTKLFIISTKIGTGKGGISTALLGYQQSNALNNDFEIFEITSHDGGGRVRPMLTSIYQLLRYCDKDDIAWLHCGPWLSMLMKFTLGLVAKFKGAKVVMHLHSPTLDYYLDNKYKRALVYQFLKISDKIVVLTPWWKKRVESNFNALHKNIEVSSNPLDSNILDIARRPIIPPKRDASVKLLSMARLVKGKGFESVLDSLTLLPSNYKLSIAGEGPLLNELKERVKRLNLDDRVKFLGWVGYENKVSVLESHDIFVLPSKYDSFGMGFIEAMAAGLPVVALDYQAIPDVVPNRVAGLLVSDSDSKSLSHAVLECAQRQYEFGTAGKLHVLANFDNEIISSKLALILQTTLKK
ncbi:glycosyltransferase family 4 protein [Vibrio fortis]|uniref:glycosyltransferase family 4 protein n=1 Tax=Vibrio fortis TaxID=212667 RepID=UPI0038CD6BA7